MVGVERVQELLAAHGEVRPQPAADWKGSFALPPQIEQFYWGVGPCNINIELPENPCFLPRLSELWAFQVGYRWSGLNDEPIHDWLDAWLVVASLGGDPFIFHRRTGSILHDFHGSGKWEPQYLFEDLNSMAACLAQLGTIFRQNGRGLWDDNGCMLAEQRGLAIDQIGELLGSKLNATLVLDRLGCR